MAINKKELGASGEDIAVRYLQSIGYRIIERNYRVRLGEIDIIAEHGQDLVFIEVKTRSDYFFGSPLESVTRPKQKQLAKVALDYISKHHFHNRPARFDVVGVLVQHGKMPQVQDTQIELVQNAFDLC